MRTRPEDRQKLRELERIIARVGAGGVRALGEEELVELPRLYRFASSQLARLETAGVGEAEQNNLRVLLARAHSVLYQPARRAPGTLFGSLLRFFVHECPRAVRAEWKLVVAGLVFFYGISAVSFFLVRSDLGLAYTLFDPAVVNMEIQQIEETPADEPFVGNFTFGTDESSVTAGYILAHNIQVSVMFFASALIPPLYLFLLSTNALMLGTHTGVASHWGRAGEISSILWCHGTLEIQAIILAGVAGLVLLRAWVAPGPWSRRHAMKLEAAQAWRLMAPVFPILFISGLIEGFISPHAPYAVRMLTAAVTGVLLVAWVLLGGRSRSPRHAM